MKGVWKSLGLALGLWVGGTSLSQARLNESLTECRQRYGEPLQLLADARGAINGAVFESREVRIEVRLTPERKVTAIEYEVPPQFSQQRRTELLERLGEIYGFTKSTEFQSPTPFASAATLNMIKGLEYLVFSEATQKGFDCKAQPDYCEYQGLIEQISACEQNLASAESKYRQLTKTRRVPLVQELPAPINFRHAISKDLQTIYFLSENPTNHRTRHRFERLDLATELTKGQAALQQCHDFTARYIQIIQDASPSFDHF